MAPIKKKISNTVCVSLEMDLQNWRTR